MLEAVGFPVAVNAETKLAAIARRRGWLIEHWTKSDGAPNRTIPIGPRTLRGPLRKQRVAAMQRAPPAEPLEFPWHLTPETVHLDRASSSTSTNRHRRCCSTTATTSGSKSSRPIAPG